MYVALGTKKRRAKWRESLALTFRDSGPKEPFVRSLIVIECHKRLRPMSKTLTYDVPEELYEAFDHIARRDGKSTEQVALEYLARRAAERRPKLSEEERQAARDRLLRYAGAVNSGDPNSADNERIDADLAREYTRTHEDGR
jgi:hypothetical protein